VCLAVTRTCVQPWRELKGNHAKSSEARSRRTDADRQATCSCCSRLGPANRFGSDRGERNGWQLGPWRTGAARPPTKGAAFSPTALGVHGRPDRHMATFRRGPWNTFTTANQRGGPQRTGVAQQPDVQVHGRQLGLLLRRRSSLPTFRSVQRADWCSSASASRARCTGPTPLHI
jgi:hypothetical protein